MPNRNEMNRFSTNPINLDISRSILDRDHGVKFSFNVGELIPFYCDEVMPGDTFSVQTSKVVRLQPLVTPIMDNVFLDTYYFFVPNRLVWSHWVNFMGENTDSAWIPQVEYNTPKLRIPSGGFNVGTIADYLGVPPKTGAGKLVNALPFRAYALICDQWFRDQNLMNPVHITMNENTLTGVNTGDQVTDIEKGGKPFVVCKYHDYFTSALPSAAKVNSNTVSFALSGLLPVNAYNDKETYKHYTPGGGLVDHVPDNIGRMVFHEKQTSTGPNPFNQFVEPQYKGNLGVYSSSGNVLQSTDTSTTYRSDTILSPNNLFADLNNHQVFNINELRNAFAIQRYYEKQARSGSRYIEMIKAFYAVDSPDARLQRAEYLGGNRLPLNVNQVEQTSATQTGLTPQGNLTGMSVTGDNNTDFQKGFCEHGYVIGVCVARYHHTYQQGLERHFLRSTKFDYYNPVFANLGERAIDSDEIYLDSADSTVFGYQEAWAEYRYKPSRVAGEMRSVYSTPLDMWHLADNYSSKPLLSANWIREDKTMLDRCLAVTSSVSNQLIADFYLSIKATRPMPLYSIPGLIDHH